jgi:hypothetical protein
MDGKARRAMTLTMYNIVLVYPTFSITTTVESGNEEMAIDDALEELRYQLGWAVDGFDSVEALEVDQ